MLHVLVLDNFDQDIDVPVRCGIKPEDVKFGTHIVVISLDVFVLVARVVDGR